MFTFSGSKMRYLFHVINVCAESTIHFLNEKTKNGPYRFETYNFFTKLTNDLIASTAFGIEENSFKNKGNEFYRLGLKMNKFGIEFFFKWMLFSVAPKVAKVIFSKEKEKVIFKFDFFFINFTVSTIKSV